MRRFALAAFIAACNGRSGQVTGFSSSITTAPQGISSTGEVPGDTSTSTSTSTSTGAAEDSAAPSSGGFPDGGTPPDGGGVLSSRIVRY